MSKRLHCLVLLVFFLLSFNFYAEAGGQKRLKTKASSKIPLYVRSSDQSPRVDIGKIKEEVLIRINHYLQSFDRLQSEMANMGDSKAQQEFQGARQKCLGFKVKIGKANAEQLNDLLVEQDELEDCSNTLVYYRSKLKLVQEFESLSKSLAKAKDALSHVRSENLPPSQTIAKLDRCHNKILARQEAFAKLTRQKMFDQGIFGIQQFLKVNKTDFKELLLALSKTKTSDPKMRNTFQEIVFNIRTLIRSWGVLGASFSPPGRDEVMAPPRASDVRVAVLFTHWTDESSDPDISSRTTIDAVLENTRDLFREFSYGRFLPEFEVFEATAEISRPETRADVTSAAIELFDPQVNYNDYEWIVIYPSYQEWQGYRDVLTLETDDGTLERSIITHGHSAFNERLLLHEGGHAQRFKHASSMECGSHTFGSGCYQRTTYGNYFVSMGARGGHYQCAEKERRGWLTPVNFTEGENDYTLTALEVVTDQPQCLKLDVNQSYTEGNFDPNEGDSFLDDHGNDNIDTNQICQDLYIEYRRPVGYDATRIVNLGYNSDIVSNIGSDGALILHCVYPECTSAGMPCSWLLDCTPDSQSGNQDFADAPLVPNATCTTGLGYTVRFEVLSDHQALVHIEAD
ncbi:MAG: hypothetical protein HYT77_03670 [Deltaproteobacteria bacterium]|nr:hypothetical protein [Deltaproteobacteria bacterium]